MKIVVIRGYEPVGTRLVSILSQLGHEVVAASSASGVSTITGEGLDTALLGAQVVVDLATAPSFEEAAALDFFRRSIRNLAAAEEVAQIKHHVSMSVVGTDTLRDRGGYFRGKWAQEMVVRASRISNTIVRSTQHFEFLGRIAESATEGRVVRLPPTLVQPIAADDVAAALADIATGAQMWGSVEVAGPERFPLSEICQRLLDANQDTRKVIPDAHAKFLGVELNDRSLLPTANARIGAIRFEDWLHQSNARKQYVNAEPQLVPT